MTAWNDLYSSFDPVAFSLFGLKVHWYGLCYVSALFLALLLAKYFHKRDNYTQRGISSDNLDLFFIWVEIGVILGARLGYILFYDPNTLWYLAHPWQIFSPFSPINGEFVGIAGMSYHGAVLGFLCASLIFCRLKKLPFWSFMDLAGVAIPLAYVLGRVGNFLNQELLGRATSVPWGIYADGALRHPSQLYEAFLEGICVFLILYFWRKKARFSGQIGLLYAILYSLARFIAEFWREADLQIGYFWGWATQGQIFCVIIFVLCGAVYFKKLKISKISNKIRRK